jgi:hypothetical protein
LPFNHTLTSQEPTVTDLRAALAALSLDSRGNKDTLKKRLLRASKKTIPFFLVYLCE